MTIAEFFEGNDDPGSIGYNLAAGPEALYPLVTEIEARPEVHAVLVDVKDWENEPDWPSADTLYVITTAGPAEVRSWFPDELAPDEWGEAAPLGPPGTEPYEAPDGYRVVFCFYD